MNIVKKSIVVGLAALMMVAGTATEWASFGANESVVSPSISASAEGSGTSGRTGGMTDGLILRRPFKVRTVKAVTRSGKQIDKYTCTTSAIRIQWLASPQAKGYIVERKDEGSNEWKPVGDLSAWKDSGVLTMRDAGLKAGTRYTYRVKAYFENVDGINYGVASAHIKTVTRPEQVKVIKAEYRGKNVKDACQIFTVGNLISRKPFELVLGNKTKKYGTVKCSYKASGDYEVCGIVTTASGVQMSKMPKTASGKDCFSWNKKSNKVECYGGYADSNGFTLKLTQTVTDANGKVVSGESTAVCCTNRNEMCDLRTSFGDWHLFCNHGKR